MATVLKISGGEKEPGCTEGLTLVVDEGIYIVVNSFNYVCGPELGVALEVFDMLREPFMHDHNPHDIKTVE